MWGLLHESSNFSGREGGDHECVSFDDQAWWIDAVAIAFLIAGVVQVWRGLRGGAERARRLLLPASTCWNGWKVFA